jgi:4-amino-4-deoxy-L-arabinose transferase-like glycosyltransferase
MKNAVLGVVFIWAVICWAAYSFGLNEVPPYHTDENYYVESVNNMIETGDYFTPYYQGQKRFSKPIFTYWLMAISNKLFGPGLVAARFWSAFLGAGCSILTFLLTRRLFGTKPALLSSLILPGTFIHFTVARWATTDMILNFFILATFYFFIRGYQEDSVSSKSYLLAYGSLSLGFLTKGPPAILIPALVISSFLILSSQAEKLFRLKFFSGLAIFLVINLPWFGGMWFVHGQEFLDHIVNVEIKNRLADEAPFSFYYFGSLFRYSLPWSFFLLSAVLVYFGFVSWQDDKTKEKNFLEKVKTEFLRLFNTESRSLLFCFLGIGIPLLLFFCLRTEHSRYLLPVFPFVCAILGLFFVQLENLSNWRGRGYFKIPFLFTILFYILIALGMGILMAFYKKIGPIPFRLGIVPLTLAFGISLLTFLFFYKRIFGIVVTLALMQMITLTFIFGDAISFYSGYPIKKFKEISTMSLEENATLAVLDLGNDRAKWSILTGKPVYGFDKPEELFADLEVKNITLIAMKEEDWKLNFSDKRFVLIQKDLRSKWKGELWMILTDLFENGIKDYFEGLAETVVLLKYEKQM